MLPLGVTGRHLLQSEGLYGTHPPHALVAAVEEIGPAGLEQPPAEENPVGCAAESENKARLRGEYAPVSRHGHRVQVHMGEVLLQHGAHHPQTVAVELQLLKDGVIEIVE